ncbi:MAG: alpha/beta hydrolase [Cyclobacteriaceae bacterium]
MKRLTTILKLLGVALLLLVLGLFAFLYFKSPGITSEFRDARGKVIENGIARMEYVTLGGVKQFILIRGKDVNHPVLLILHGGPGSPELPMFREHNSELENHFTVVYWDQRGAGKSVTENVAGNFTMDQFIEDTHQLTGYLKTIFRKEKVFLLGHSWGSLLGVQTVARYPEDYHAYVGTGQFGNQPKSDSLSYVFALQKAIQLSDTVAMNDLTRIGAYEDENLNRTGFMNWLHTSRVYVSKFGGSTADPKASMKIFLRPILNCKEYTITDKYNLIKSNSPSAFANSPFSEMVQTVLKFNLTQVDELQVPVYFLQGRHDKLTNFSVAKEYFDVLKAPRKEFIEFDQSAHFPAFEEPGKFNAVMIDRVLEEGRK